MNQDNHRDAVIATSAVSALIVALVVLATPPIVPKPAVPESPVRPVSDGYTVYGTRIVYHPVARGTASWYGREFAGHTMANGQPFDPTALTCATWTYPIGTHLLVVRGNKSVIVTVTDRGPAPHLNRLLDLSQAAFAELAAPDLGVIDVMVEALR